MSSRQIAVHAAMLRFFFRGTSRAGRLADGWRSYIGPRLQPECQQHPGGLKKPLDPQILLGKPLHLPAFHERLDIAIDGIGRGILRSVHRS